MSPDHVPAQTDGDSLFPWPVWQPKPGITDPETGSTWGLATAMAWPNLTPAERAVAMFVGDGAGGPGMEASLAHHLCIPLPELIDHLWTLNRKGFLMAVAGWWTE